MQAIAKINRVGTLALFLVIAVAAVACGGGSTTSVASGAASQGDDGPQSFDDLEYSSPIGDFLGFSFTGGEDSEEQFAEIEREAGRMTTACMLEKGFEYTPADMGSFTSFNGDDGLPAFSTEWIDKYGFGISTQRFPQSSVGELVGFDDEGFGPDAEFVDPNEEYVESLSEGEREAYQEALWGQPPDFGPEGPSEDFEFEPSGCQNEAFQQAFEGGPGGNVGGFYEEFSDDLDALRDRVNADPQVVSFNNDVADCVSEAGMVWVDQEELYERFERQMDDLQPQGFMQDPFEGTDLNPEEMSDSELDDFFRDLNRLDPSQLAKLAEVQAEEIALAKVVVGCGGGPLNEEVVIGEIRVKYEQEFLDANADALAEFKTAE